MIEKNLKTRNKFINKIIIKIKNLNNNISLLLKVDKKILKNIINQYGGGNSNNYNNSIIDLLLQFENLKKMPMVLNDLIKNITDNYLAIETLSKILSNNFNIPLIKSINIPQQVPAPPPPPPA